MSPRLRAAAVTHRSMTAAGSRPSMTRRIVLLGVLALAASLPIASAAMGRLAAAFEATGETWGGYELFLLAIGILGGTSAGDRKSVV